LDYLWLWDPASGCVDLALRDESWELFAGERVMGTPTIADVNDDCQYDLLATDAGGRVWLWNLGLSCATNTLEWGEHGLDVRNTFTYVGNGSRHDGMGPSVSLDQNEPNPFNPRTTISYSIGTQARVRLAIFDAGGREIMTLVDEGKSAGQHHVVWDGVDWSGRQLASGVYFYELRVEGVRASRKLLLLR
jgi:hypothetical protein